MVLGVLSLFQKRGLFYSEQEVHSTHSFSNMDMQELEKVTDKFLDFKNPTKQYKVHPTEESGNTDYITATFEDQGDAQYPYEVTVWLLIEEAPEEVQVKNEK